MTETEDTRGPAYRVETARLVIRCWMPSDAVSLRAALDDSDRHLRPWIPFMRDEPRSLEASAAWLRGNRGRFDLDQDFRYGIFDPDEREVIGEAVLLTRAGPNAREMGYWLARSAAGKGYATEAAAAMIRVGFEIDRVNRIEIRCAPENAASAAIPARLGFTHEGTLRRRFTDSEGDIHDSMVWTLFADDYPGSEARKARLRAFDALDRIMLDDGGTP